MTSPQYLRKPDWLRMELPDSRLFSATKKKVARGQLNTICHSAACPNIGHCYQRGTASFLILGDICTRNCRFCNVKHGTPVSPDPEEPFRLARTVAEMELSYVVITSVTRDDLDDGGASHFQSCVEAIKRESPQTGVEILTPDFRNCLDSALPVLQSIPADVFNHNIETVPRLYPVARRGADFQGSLNLLKTIAQTRSDIPVKSGIMVGLGETMEEIHYVMQHLYEHGCRMLTIGQYLAPSKSHLPVARYVNPDEFDHLAEIGYLTGFDHVASGPLVRSSYHADISAELVNRQKRKQSGTYSEHD